MGGGTTPTTGNAAGSMNTWADLSALKLQDQNLYKGISTAFNQLGAGIAGGHTGSFSTQSQGMPYINLQPAQQNSDTDIIEVLKRLLQTSGTRGY